MEHIGLTVPPCVESSALMFQLVDESTSLSKPLVSNRRNLHPCSKGCGCVLVVDGSHKLLGTFTDGDLRRKLSTDGGSVLQMTMQQLMSATPRVTTADTKVRRCKLDPGLKPTGFKVSL